MVRRSTFVDGIKKAIESGKLPKRFRPIDVQQVVQGYAEGTYSSFLAKHRKGNKGNLTEYFVRHTDSTYSLL